MRNFNKFVPLLLGVVVAGSMSACGVNGSETDVNDSGSREIVSETEDNNSEQEKVKASIVIDTPEWCKEWSKYNEGVELDYSDVDDESEKNFYPFFRALKDNSYFILDDGTSKYALINYTFVDYGKTIEKLNELKIEYSGNDDNKVLELSLDADYESHDYEGCIPNMSTLEFLIQLDSEICGICVDSENNWMEEYRGGEIVINERRGWLNADMEMVIPAEFQYINLMNIDADDQYYRASNEVIAGVFNSNGEWIFSPELGYTYFYYIDGKFAMAAKYDYKNDIHTTYVLDENGQPTGKEFNGYIEKKECETIFDNEYKTAVFNELVDGESRYGVVNANFDIVIPAKYKDIVKYCDSELGENVTDFVCENEEGKYAFFLYDGTQKSDFIYDSEYDANEANN